MNYETKDSGDREVHESGMVRDIQAGKPRYDLIVAKNGFSLLKRWAELMERGAVKYGDRNWEKANTEGEMDRAKASAFRHFMQWFYNEEDEDHAAAVLFNVQEAEYVKDRLSKPPMAKPVNPAQTNYLMRVPNTCAYTCPRCGLRVFSRGQHEKWCHPKGFDELSMLDAAKRVAEQGC